VSVPVIDRGETPRALRTGYDCALVLAFVASRMFPVPLLVWCISLRLGNNTHFKSDRVFAMWSQLGQSNSVCLLVGRRVGDCPGCEGWRLSLNGVSVAVDE
jgi:hypothetical protein